MNSISKLVIMDLPGLKGEGEEEERLRFEGGSSVSILRFLLILYDYEIIQLLYASTDIFRIRRNFLLAFLLEAPYITTTTTRFAYGIAGCQKFVCYPSS